MKKTLIAFSILLASVAHAGEIYPYQFDEVVRKNAAAFMNITEGMTANYYETSEEKGGIKCDFRRKEVIVGIQAPIRYLVYVKETNMNDCSDSKKGEVAEYLKWKKIDKSVLSGKEMRSRFVDLDENIASFKYANLVSDGYVKTAQIDVTQSQFYANLHFNSGKGQVINLLNRSQTDVKTLSIDNLVIVEF
jgi:hypothetical protein